MSGEGATLPHDNGCAGGALVRHAAHATLTIDVDSDAGAWARAIRHTPRLSAQVHETMPGGFDPVTVRHAGEAGEAPPLSVAPDLAGETR